MTAVKTDIDQQIDQLEYQLQDLKARVADLRRSRPAEPVKDYRFKTWDGGEVALSELFGDHDELILVHNMGRACSYCTMWADGFTGLLPHLEDRAAFVVTSPDAPEEQREFATGRGWSFPMVSAEGSSFIEEMGFLDSEEGYMPGVSTFRREGGTIQRVGRAEFGPGDDFCAVWHLFDLLPGGSAGWEPKFSYGS